MKVLVKANYQHIKVSERTETIDTADDIIDICYPRGAGDYERTEKEANECFADLKKYGDGICGDYRFETIK